MNSQSDTWAAEGDAVTTALAALSRRNPWGWVEGKGTTIAFTVAFVPVDIVQMDLFEWAHAVTDNCPVMNIKKSFYFSQNAGKAALHHAQQRSLTRRCWKSTELEEIKGMWNWKWGLNRSYQGLFAQKYLWLLLHTDYLQYLRKSLEIIYDPGYWVLFEFPTKCAKIRQIRSKIVTDFLFHWVDRRCLCSFLQAKVHYL